VEHLHPIYQDKTSRPWDDTYRNAKVHWAEDARLFGERVESLQSEVDPVVEKKMEEIAGLWDG
jgi:hypothetical protein